MTSVSASETGPQRNAAAVFTGIDVDPTDAASVLLVRDGRASVEVPMMERHAQTDFAGGACVFPGGRVTDADRAFPRRLFLPDLAEYAATVGTTGGKTIGLLVAAVRETFEEAGVLLARHVGHGAWVEPEVLDRPETQGLRRALAQRGSDTDWVSWIEAEGFTLDLRCLTPWAWWVIPKGQHRRYDTRFFVATMPPVQRATADRVEAVDVRWSTPADFLHRQASGELKIIFPTRPNLMGLIGFAGSDAVVRAASSGLINRRRTEPRIEHIGGAAHVVHPFDDVMEQI